MIVIYSFKADLPKSEIYIPKIKLGIELFISNID